VKHIERALVAIRLREAGLKTKAERFELCHNPDEGWVYKCPKCGHVGGYVPLSCMVVGCPYCSSLQGASVRALYKDSLLALWLKREAGEWLGRFWFLTFTYRMDDDEDLQAGLVKVRKAFTELSRWLMATHGHGESGVVASVEIGPKQLEKVGRAGQIHVHAIVALDSCAQIGPYRYIVGRESNQSIIVRVDFDSSGDIEKQKIESKWIKLIGRDCPVSRFYEKAPAGLPLSVDRDKVKESLERLGLKDDLLKKALYYNTGSTISAACHELLKYVTKTGKLTAEALAVVIIAFHRKRRVWSLGILNSSGKSKKREKLLDYLKAWIESHGGHHPFGDRCKCKECSECGELLKLESAWSVAQSDPVGLAGALADYLVGRVWLDTANNPNGKADWRAPPGLVKWWRRLSAGADLPQRLHNLNDW